MLYKPLKKIIDLWMSSINLEFDIRKNEYIHALRLFYIMTHYVAESTKEMQP